MPPINNSVNPFLNLVPQQPKRYDLFISHSWDYGDHRTNLGQLIANSLAPNQAFDHSAPQDDPIHAANDQDLVLALFDRIGKANVLIFPAGVYATHSKWIPVEIGIAGQLGKPIIAVEIWGSERSTNWAKQAHEIVGWNGNSVARAIRRWHP